MNPGQLLDLMVTLVHPAPVTGLDLIAVQGGVAVATILAISVLVRALAVLLWGSNA